MNFYTIFTRIVCFIKLMISPVVINVYKVYIGTCMFIFVHKSGYDRVYETRYAIYLELKTVITIVFQICLLDIILYVHKMYTNVLT